MATRRASGEGSFRQRPNGLWEATIRYQTPDGPKRLSVYGQTRDEARRKLSAARKRLKSGGPVRDDTRTVGAWLETWRTTSLPASDRKAATVELYTSLCRKHLEGDPTLAGMRLDKLRPTDVEALVLRLRAKGLAESSVRSVYVVLRGALDIAVRDQLLASNPAAVVRRPSVARQEARYLSTDDVVRLLAHLDGQRYATAVRLMAHTGMRRGEVAGLRWVDVDLDRSELVVTGTVGRVGGELVRSAPKSERSRRRVPLTEDMVTELRAHRTAQLEERLRAGDQWTDTGMVFVTEFGTMVDARNVLRTVETAARKAGLTHVGAHTLRHSAAVAWLENGVHIKAAADLLGHGSIAVTGDLYGHTSDGAARAAVDGLGRTLSAKAVSGGGTA